MSEQKQCVFCDFDNNYILEANEHAFACHFDCAIKTGHIVVALKKHVTSLSRLSEEQAAGLMALAATVAKKAEPLIGCEKFYLVSIADETPHYHIHLLPKLPGDAPIGRHIMSDSGWRGEAGHNVKIEDIIDFISKYKNAGGKQ